MGYNIKIKVFFVCAKGEKSYKLLSVKQKICTKVLERKKTNGKAKVQNFLETNKSFPKAAMRVFVVIKFENAIN